MKFVALSSSRGTTFEAVLQAIKDGELHAECFGLITDREDRGCREKAEHFGVPVRVVERRKDEPREEYDKRLDAAIRELGSPDYLCALGWMWLLTPWFIGQWRDKIINVHPALLPKFPGAGAHAIDEALTSGDAESGMTIHLIDEGVDTGKILLQKSCAIEENDTRDSLWKKIQLLEKEWYPKALAMIERGELSLQ